MRVAQKLLLTRRIKEPFLPATNVCRPTVGAEHVGMKWGPGDDKKTKTKKNIVLYCEKTKTKPLSNSNLNSANFTPFSDHEPLGPM